MAIATSVAKKLRYKKETSFGTLTDFTGGQLLRRTESTLSLTKATYESGEIRTDYQVSDFRHGMKSVEGSISGELSAGTYKDFMETICRQAWTAAETGTALTGLVAAYNATTGVATVTRGSGSWITDGFQVGNVVKFTGFAVTTTDATANNNKPFLITGLSATVMTGAYLNGSAMIGKTEPASVTTTKAGKRNSLATTGHVNDSYLFEHWHSDINQSERFSGCRLTQMSVKLPPTGMATVEFSVLGKDMTSDVTARFASPNNQTTTGVLAAVNGALYVDGTKVALLTGLEFTVNGNMSNIEVVGSNTTPDILQGRMQVSGQMTVLFQDEVMRDKFVTETPVSIVAAFASDNSATASFLSFCLPRVKIGGATKDDGDKGIQQTMPFTAILNTDTTTGLPNTTFAVMDSNA